MGNMPDLDNMFRDGSKARVVAERLLTGQPYTIAELVEGLDLSRTTVPRVVEMLTDAGVEIERTTDRTRQASYRAVVEILRDRRSTVVVAEFTGKQGPDCTVKRVDTMGTEFWMSWEMDGQKYRGRIIQHPTVASALMGRKVQLLGLCLLESGLTAMRIGDQTTNVLVDRATIR